MNILKCESFIHADFVHFLRVGAVVRQQLSFRITSVKFFFQS